MILPIQEWNVRTLSTITTGDSAFRAPEPSFGIDTQSAIWIFPEHQLARILVNRFSCVPQVKSICITFGAEGYTVWSLLDSYDRDAREAVYVQELKVCEMLHIYDFDFRVTSIDLVTAEELIATGSIEIFRRP